MTYYIRNVITLTVLLFCVFIHVSGENSDPVASGSLMGKVTDKADNTPIIGAYVTIPDLRMGTMTDENGKYAIGNLPKGAYMVQVSYIGYATFTLKVDFSKTGQLDVQLVTSSVEAGEVIITGVSKATESKREPVPTVAVGKPFIEQQAGSGNIIDALANLPGISAVTTGPNISKPYIHGLGYNRVITMEDGIRQEGQQWGDEHGVEVDQNSIDRVEIIKGPASLAYGSDAIGGVVNLLTASPVPDGKILGSAQGVYGTNNGLVNGSFKLQGSQNGLVWGTTFSGKMAKNYEDPHDGRVYATGFRELDGRGMIGLNRSWGYSYLNASLFDDLQDIPDGSRNSVTRQFTKQITDIDSFRTIVSSGELNSYQIPVLHQHVQFYRVYDNSNIPIGNGNLLINLGYQYSHRQEFTHPQNPGTPGLNLELTTYTYDLKYNFDIAGGFESSVGVNGMYQQNVLGFCTDFPIPAYHEFDMGPFFVTKKTFGKLDLSGGIRYDIRSFTQQALNIDTLVPYFPVVATSSSNPTDIVHQFPSMSKTFSGVSGSVGGTYNFSEHFLLKGNIARGYRAPSIAELSANGPDPGSQTFHVGNTHFSPEFSLQEDIGIFLTLDRVSASAEIYNNTLQNYIFQHQVLDSAGNPERVNANGQENPNGQYAKFTYDQSTAMINGGEFSLDIHPMTWLHFSNSLTLTYGTNIGNGEKIPDSLKYLPFIPPLHTHSELKGSFRKGFGAFENAYVVMGFDHFNAQNRYFSAYGTETYTAGYNLLSAGFGSDIINRSGRVIGRLFVEGTNLGNISYQSNMSRLKYFDNPSVPAGIQPGIFNMGRNISVKFIVPFDLSPKSRNNSGV